MEVIEKVFLISTSNHMFRPGHSALILGVRSVAPKDSPPRLCYMLKYIDGYIDYMPISESENFMIVTESGLNGLIFNL